MTTKTTKNNTQQMLSAISGFDADLKQAIHRDATLNPNLFYYNKKVLNYYLEMPRIVAHHQTQKYRRTR